ncbi:hypothetical protein F2Q68_00013515 [Brassica cretica]|uniref:Uncharacterized protein n=1 Tax=Brassica cretica TaxID=69181 RepID=A0A8S9HH49_BRACR|nr:hypothetical protein F2Q68_00013515 [Brassica cretica]
MMQAPDIPHIHVTSDRQVRNLLEITKTQGVRLCVSSRSKVETVSEFREEDDEADECFEDDDDDLVEDENHDGEEDDGEEDDGEEDAGISIVAEADENGEDYSVYGKVEDEDEEDDDILIRRLALIATAGRVSLVFVFILIYVCVGCRDQIFFWFSDPFSSESGDGLEVCTFVMDEVVIVNYVTGEASPMQTTMMGFVLCWCLWLSITGVEDFLYWSWWQRLEHGSCLLKLWEVGKWTSMASNLIKMEANDSYRDDFNFGYDGKRKSSQISMMVFGLMKEAASNQGMAVLCFYAQLVLGWEQSL